MKLRVLRYFVVVTEEKNMTKASKKLHVSQPTISRQIHALEHELGAKLFESGSREIHLTPAGEYLVQKAKQMLKIENLIEENIRAKTNSISGKVVVGCNELVSVATLAQATKAISEQYPDIKVEITSTNAKAIENGLHSGTLDLGIIMTTSDREDYQFLTLNGEQEWGLFLPKNSALAKQKTISRQDLLQSNLIISSQSEFSDLLKNWLGNSSANLKVKAYYDLLYNALFFVQSGIGYVVGLSNTINTMGTDIVFRPFAPSLTSQSEIIWLKNTTLSPAAQVLLSRIKKLVRR